VFPRSKNNLNTMNIFYFHVLILIRTKEEIDVGIDNQHELSDVSEMIIIMYTAERYVLGCDFNISFDI
jgi:hypothetical protein